MDGSTHHRLPAPDLSVPGLRIYPRTREHKFPLLVVSDEPQANWREGGGGPAHQAERLGSTLIYGTEAYRIGKTEDGDGGARVYHLRPWPAGETWQHLVRLDRKSVERELSEARQFRRMERLTAISPYYEVFLGFLPAVVQEWLSRRLRFSPHEASAKNGMLEFFVFFALSARVIGPYWGSLIGLLPLALATEGFVRWHHAKASERACGLLVIELLAWPFRRIYRAL